MATGWNTGDSISNAKNFMIDTARAERDNGSVMTRVVDRRTLTKNQGKTWDETAVLRMDDPADITENTDLNNYQLYQTSAIQIQPTMTGMAVLWTQEAKDTLSTKVIQETSVQVQQSFDRRKDKDLLIVLDTFASLGGAGQILTQGFIGAAAARNRTGLQNEPWTGSQATIIRSEQVYAIENELLSGIGTYAVPNGLTEEVYRRGYKGMVRETEVFVDDSSAIDGSGDFKGGTFARGNGGAIVLVQGFDMRVLTKDAPEKGGGSEITYHYDKYAAGIRNVAWGTELYFAADVPTS
jgi:hypothetical protein